LWDANSGQELQTLKGHALAVLSVAFSPDGKRLATGSDDRTVKLWDAQSGQELGSMNGHSSEVWGVAFSPDGSRLASASSDRTVKVWDTVSGQELRTLKGHTSRVVKVAFSPDGTVIAAAGVDGTVRIWDAGAYTPEAQAQAEAIHHLEALFTKPLPSSEVRAAIQRDPFLGNAARRKALDLAERFKEETDATKYHAAAWPVIRHPYANGFVCRFALAQMNAACERAPDNVTYRSALGGAQYRLGRFQKERYPEALATLTRCDQDQPATLAFLGMTQHQLGQAEQARTTLTRLRDLRKEPAWVADAEAEAFVREAATLIEGKQHEPKP
jgi:hypothetical protein